MKRIMFSIHVGDSIAHILRTRELAKYLSDCGHQIAYCIPYKGVKFLEGYLETKDIRVTDQYYSLTGPIPRRFAARRLIPLGYPVRLRRGSSFKPPVILNGASYFLDDIKQQDYLYSGINMALKGSSLIRNPDANMAFVSFGTGLAEHSSQILSKLLKLIESHFDKIYVCYGIRADLNDLYQPKNAVFERIYNQLPTNVGVLICHGGYAMLHLGIEICVPIIAIPLQLEQYSNSVKMETLGVGKNLATFNKDDFRGFYQRTVINLDAVEDEITNIKEPVILPKLIDRFKSKPDLFFSQVDDLINKLT